MDQDPREPQMRRGAIDQPLGVSGEVGSVSVVSRSSLATGFLASNEMSGYGGCTKEEGESVC
jgi:hypothetical protein